MIRLGAYANMTSENERRLNGRIARQIGSVFCTFLTCTPEVFVFFQLQSLHEPGKFLDRRRIGTFVALQQQRLVLREERNELLLADAADIVRTGGILK